ncbi:trehalose-phosphatase [Stakelama marina]|uniref:Trehalose 6-phosphate phosphatase n=1 Tax=Stakelama marina TaxID=2826939 RepID=A0A8T4IAG7_9SPHN|nr:trehalose-phosphatase [Stakelama marina]MBR0551363.1 trehalose-phosphatase [Stakelama marina]
MTNAATNAPQTDGIGALANPPRDLLRGSSLFLDFDGTLVEIAARPDGIEVDARLRSLVKHLAAALDGRLAIVSGRPMQSIAEYLGEGFAVSGSHGLEMRWADGREVVPARPDGLDTATAELKAFAEHWDGVLIEEKPFGVGLHYREAAAEAEDASRLLVEQLADATGLKLQAGKKVFELRLAGAHKGAAIAAFMDTPPFAGSSPVFLGDDVTDEDGFEAVAQLGGAGILVGDVRPTLARYRLDDVTATLDWLEAAKEALR